MYYIKKGVSITPFYKDQTLQLYSKESATAKLIQKKAITLGAEKKLSIKFMNIKAIKEAIKPL